jgi:hypothetical protein
MHSVKSIGAATSNRSTYLAAHCLMTSLAIGGRADVQLFSGFIFVSADLELNAAAEAEGLLVENPSR